MALPQNKYLTFTLGHELYGIHVLKVKEILGILEITHVPRMPAFMKGVVNLRGKIIPIIDLRVRFNLPSKEYDNRTCTIVVEVATESGKRLNGLLVDTVSEVLDIDETLVEPPPKYGNSVDLSFISGIAKIKDKIIMLLNIDRIIANEDTELINKLGGISNV